jgi:hypothetical protein
MRYQIRPVKLNKYFPPNDELALRIAQLCILREDHLLELRGITIDSAGELDGKFEEWRSLYFFRKSARTINEIRKAIGGMGTLNQYKQLLNSDLKERSRIRKLTSELDKEYQHVKDLGDNVGAHILHRHLKDTLNDLDTSWEGFLQIGEIAGHVHYKFAGEIVLAMLVPKVPEKHRRAHFESILRRMASKSSVIELIDRIFALYHHARKL